MSVSDKKMASLPDKEMNDLKGDVLISRVDYLSAELGDPGRYFPALRAKGVLLPEDCEKIKAKVTSNEKVYEMVELIYKRHSEKDGHAMDVLIEALRKQRVQAHIARELQRALAHAKDQRKGVVSDGLDASPLSTPSTATPANSQKSLASIATPTSRLTTPSESAVPSPHQFEIHPQHGALPPLPPPNKTAPSASAQPSADIDPRFGQLPANPPPPRHGAFRPTQEGTPPGVGEVATGMSGIHLHGAVSGPYPNYHNGEYHATGEESLDRRNSDLSYTTTSGTAYSTTSTEQSGLEYGRAQGEEVGVKGERQDLGRLQGVEYEGLLKRKELEVAQLKRENTHLSTRLKEIEDRFDDLEKQYAQMCEKVRMCSISEQQHLLESHKPGREEGDLVTLLRRQLQEKDQQIALLGSQVEQYQQDNQQLQLSLSGTARPHHLPISTVPGRGQPVRQYTPVRASLQAGGGESSALQGTPAAGLTPMKSYRVGDSLNQHNIHLQQSWGSGPGSRRDSPAYSPGKDPSVKGPAVFSPGRDGGGGKAALFSPGSGKRLSGGSGDTPMGESYFQSSSSSLNSSGSKGSAGVTLQTAPNADQHSTMV